MRWIATVMLGLAATLIVCGQESDAPTMEEVLRQVPRDPHALDFVLLGWSPGRYIESSLHGDRLAQTEARLVDGTPVYTVGGGVTSPRGIKMPDPDYPEKLRARGIEGGVLLWVVVGADGRPHDITIGRSGGSEFDKAAIKAVNKWRFKPATKDGTPVAARINVEVNFRLYH